MIHKAWSCIEYVPCCLSMSSFQISRSHGTKKIIDFGPNWGFRTLTRVSIHWWVWNYAQSVNQHRKVALLFFNIVHKISRSHGTKNYRFWPELSVSVLQLQFELTHDFEMMHNAWCSIEEVPYFKLIHQISRLHRTKKNRRFWPQLSVSGL